MKKRVRDTTQIININKRTTGNPAPVRELTEEQLMIVDLVGNQTVVGVDGISPSGFGPVQSNENHDAQRSPLKQIQLNTQKLSNTLSALHNATEKAFVESPVSSTPPPPPTVTENSLSTPVNQKTRTTSSTASQAAQQKPKREE